MHSSSARAEASDTEVLVTGDAIGPDVMDILQGALQRDGIRLKRAANAPRCVDAIVDSDVPVRVWISWAPSEAGAWGTGRGAPLRLCFQDHCRSAERTLGLFAKLDAPAREELITVIESGLAALRSSCPDAQPAAALVPEPRPLAGAAASSSGPTASPVRAASVSGSEVAGASSSAPTKPSVETGARHTRDEPASSAAIGSATDTPPATAREPEPRSESIAPPAEDALPASRPAPNGFAIGGSYGVTRWTDNVLGQQVTAMAAYAVHTQPLYVGLEVAYGPRFRALRDALAIDATSLRLALQLWARWPLVDRIALEAQIGPAIEWLWLVPQSGTSRLLSTSRSTSHGDPLLFVRFGPALRVYAGLRLGLELQLDTSWIQRSFGFVSNDGPKGVFSPDRMRLSMALNVRADL